MEMAKHKHSREYRVSNAGRYMEIKSRIAPICYAITREFMERYGLEVYGVA